MSLFDRTLCLPRQISSDLAHALMGKLVRSPPKPRGDRTGRSQTSVCCQGVCFLIHIFLLAGSKRASAKILKTVRHVALKTVRCCVFLREWRAVCCQARAECTRGCPRRQRGGHTCRRIDRGCRARSRITLGAHLINGQVGKRAP